METGQKQRKHAGCIIAIAALTVLTLGLIGYIVCEKTIWRKECDKCEAIKAEEENVNEDNDTSASDDVSINAIAALANSDEYKREGCFVVSYSGPQDSSVAPYQILQGGLGYNGNYGSGCGDGGGGVGFYLYRVNPDAEWQFGMAGQNVSLCSQFDTDDLKKAFADLSCWNAVDYSEGEGQLISISSLL